jgi:hypothetical protein
MLSGSKGALKRWDNNGLFAEVLCPNEIEGYLWLLQPTEVMVVKSWKWALIPITISIILTTQTKISIFVCAAIRMRVCPNIARYAEQFIVMFSLPAHAQCLISHGWFAGLLTLLCPGCRCNQAVSLLTWGRESMVLTWKVDEFVYYLLINELWFLITLWSFNTIYGHWM